MKKISLLILILNILIATVANNIFLLTKNTLLNNDNWDSEKVKLEMGVMGSMNFFSETQALNNNHLDLGTWHGYQEVNSRETLQYDQLEFDALIEDGAYLINHFIINNNRKFSIKISDKPTENFCLTIEYGGKFLKKIPLGDFKIKPNEWFHTKINLNNQIATIVINEQLFTCDVPNALESKIGFRGGEYNTLIDEIVVRNDGKIIFKESFSSNKKLLPITLLVFALLTIIQIIFYRKKTTNFHIALVSSSLLLSIVVAYLYLLHIFTGNYPNPKSFLSNLEGEEEVWVNRELKLISNEVMEKFSNINHEKIMFIGTSQTFGAGASSYNKSFPAIFGKLLNDTISGSPLVAAPTSEMLETSAGQTVEIINTGASGQKASGLLNEYRNRWIKLKPMMVLVNLSNNDFEDNTPSEKFKKTVEDFVEISNKNNIKIILLVEATSAEVNKKNPLEEIIKKVAKEKNVFLIDINKHLREENDTGLLWWDYIHPTDYGHQLIAEYIFAEIIKSDSIQSIL